MPLGPNKSVIREWAPEVSLIYSPLVLLQRSRSLEGRGSPPFLFTTKKSRAESDFKFAATKFLFFSVHIWLVLSEMCKGAELHLGAQPQS